MKPTIAIIDIIGLTYDGNTLNLRGLGGSESAVILLSKELSLCGFDVTVFNNCIDKHASPGVYAGVKYVDISKIDSVEQNFDIVISSRTVIPFITEDLHPYFFQFDPARFKQLAQTAKFKAVWMHDTFCKGDEFLERLLLNGSIDEIFTLSDFHTTYVSTADHGHRRMPEVLKNKIFMTRNGAVNYFPEVDISKKDRNLFVYNASVTKGMLPLVKNIWPLFKSLRPNARLKVIGGYYRFRENAAPDEQEKTWRELVNDPIYKTLDVEFTGILRQQEIAEILSSASFMVYPGAFPETFGISTLESLLYNTPLITTRFGALEETAIDSACYKIDYCIEPNGLFPNISLDDQSKKFVQLMLSAYDNTYLHQQKMYACNAVKTIAGWDSVALQWKQHLFKKLGLYLPASDYQKITSINAEVKEVFGRRFSNPEENYLPRNTQQHITVITPVFNAEKYIEQCVQSVITQDYDNWDMYIIDDCSTDCTSKILDELSELDSRIHIIHQTYNAGAVKNQVVTIKKICSPDDIILLLDGDDALVNDNQIFHFYNNLYTNDQTEFTYGSCFSLADKIPLVAQPYPEEIKKSKRYRDHKFNWNMPYTHLRTFRARLMLNIPDDKFKDANGNWYKAGGDNATFYEVIERADPNKVKAISRINYLYNDLNPINDWKVNGHEQTANAKFIGKSNLKSMKTILIAIPTAKYIEPETFKSIYDLEVPEGYRTEFQYFFGYALEQVRNLISDWAQRYDYLFAVDSDMSFKPDTLKRLLSHDKDVVSGLYIQRKPGEHILELYRNGHNIPYGDIKNLGLVEIDACGFGCVLVKSKVFSTIGYPQFVYKSALDHKDTVSEDVYFCMKAKQFGFSIYADANVICDHIGSTKFVVDQTITKKQSAFDRLLELSNTRLLPSKHVEYLYDMSKSQNIKPKVIFDIGACVLHWTREAVNVWPDAKFFAFEAMQESELIFKHFGVPHFIGVLSDQNNKEVSFYKNVTHPGGNSYYRENDEIVKNASAYFNEGNKEIRKTVTLDTLMKSANLPQPDLIKMDVQGAELDILKGGLSTLTKCQDVILELQKIEYNKGAPLKDEVIQFMLERGFKLISGPFCDNGPDGDYHFSRI